MTALSGVSVITPLLNQEEFVAETLESVLDQTHQDFELLVIDNGSTDLGPDIVRGLAAHDDRIRLLHEPRPGASHARNRGIANARHQWLAMLDADDLWMPEKLERHLQLIEEFQQRTGRRIVATGTFGIHIGSRGKEVGLLHTANSTLEEVEEAHRAGKLIYLNHSSVMLRRDAVLEAGGYRNDYFPSDDLDLYTRLADLGVVINFPEFLFKYRVHRLSASTSHFFYQQENALRAAHNLKRRRLGQRELDYDEFMEEILAADPLWIRWIRNLTWASQQKYRTAGGELANGRYLRGGANLLVAGLLDPLLVCRRFAHQVLGRFRESDGGSRIRLDRRSTGDRNPTG